MKKSSIYLGSGLFYYFGIKFARQDSKLGGDPYYNNPYSTYVFDEETFSHDLPGCDIIYIPTTIHVLIIPSHIQRKDKILFCMYKEICPARTENK